MTPSATSRSRRPDEPGPWDNPEWLLGFLVLIVGCVGWYIASVRFHLSHRQIAESVLYALSTLAVLLVYIIRVITRRARIEKQWPHPPLMIQPGQIEKDMRKAWGQDSIVLGYDVHGRPWFWPDRIRVMQSVLPGDLQTVFVDPQVRELEALGVEIRYESDVCAVVMHEGGVAAVAQRDGTEVSADVYALCTPFEVTRTWLHDSLYEGDPELGNMHFLEAQPMAALHLWLRRKLPDLPREHVFFHGGLYALSLIDVFRLWKGLDGNSRLSFIASNYGPLSQVSEEGAKDLLLEEIGEYLPITPADVESWELNSNTQIPLFINTIGAWPNRPRPKSRIKNLYLAGDFVKNAIDLACMEGAVSAALETASQILSDHGENKSLPVAETPPVWPRIWMVSARILLIPVVAVARMIAWLEEKLSPHRPDASAVRRKATPRLQMDTRPPRKR